MTKSPINVNIVPDIPDSTKEEALNPSANLLGQAFRGIAHKVLDPLVRYNIVKDSEMDDFSAKIKSKTSNIPLKYRDSEKIGLAFKAVEDSTYQLNSEELREMFANLISSSVDSRINSKLHPSFSTILKDMSSEDALLFRELNEYQTMPTVTIRIKVGSNGPGVDIIENIILAGDKYLNRPNSLTNLERLGLIEVVSGTYLSSDQNKEKYNRFEQSEYFLMQKRRLPIQSGDLIFTDIEIKKGKLELTKFGVDFGNMVITR